MKTQEERQVNAAGLLVLPTTFIDRGWNFTQVKRVGNNAIYFKEKDGARSWEVIKIREQKAFVLGGVEIPAKEAYPASEQWGTFGWSYADLESAENRFAKL